MVILQQHKESTLQYAAVNKLTFHNFHQQFEPLTIHRASNCSCTFLHEQIPLFLQILLINKCMLRDFILYHLRPRGSYV